jgi:hypothetical protein
MDNGKGEREQEAGGAGRSGRIMLWQMAKGKTQKLPRFREWEQ